MPGENSLLFGQPLSSLKWGVTPGGHVAHIITNNEPDATTIDTNKENEIEVTQADVYNNVGDNKTSEYFMNLAKESSEDFEADYADEQFRDYLYSIRDYVTASSRSKQAGILKSMKEQQAKYIANLNKRIESAPKDPTPEERQELELNQKRLERITHYSNNMLARTEGNLEVPKDVNDQLMSQPVTNPKKRYHLGFWVKDNSPLFPHEPSPADIKQGLGVQDCFMLSALSGLAAKNPQAIKDSMKDNNDGTVTVRFYNDVGNGKPKEPVFIRVEKSANKLAGVGNLYASSSLWVQMMEKAYVKYVNKYLAPKMLDVKEAARLRDGYNGIQRSSTDIFMNAFSPERYYQGGLNTPIGSFTTPYNFKGKDGDISDVHPKGYLPEEKEFFDFLTKQVKNPNSVITCGCHIPAPAKWRGDYAKSKGIRTGHAYTLLDTFEKVVDGEKKKFVKLQDPYGVFSAGYDKGKLKSTSSPISGTLNAGADNMGTFNLEYTDFLKIFTTLPGILESEGEAMFLNKKKWRDYDTKPLTKDELNADLREMVNEPEVKTEKTNEVQTEKTNEVKTEKTNEAQAERVNEAQAPKKDAPANKVKNNVLNIYNAIKTPEGLNKFAKNLNNICKDINNTDEWFVWTNTKEFNKMRDDAYALRDNIAKMTKDGKFPSDEELKKLAGSINNTAASASKYADNKSTSIRENRTKGKDPSVRAKHRLSAAIDLMNVCSAKEPAKSLPNKAAEDTNIIVNDLNERISMQNAGQKIPHDNKTVDMAVKELNKQVKLIESDPAIKQKGKISDETVNTAKKNIKENPIAKEKAPAKDNSFLSDFEMI